MTLAISPFAVIERAPPLSYRPPGGIESRRESQGTGQDQSKNNSLASASPPFSTGLARIFGERHP
jgi:hypothetical protein